MHEICIIHSNSMEFSANGQGPESIELMWMNFVANFAKFAGTVGKMREISMICCNFTEKELLKSKILLINLKMGEPKSVQLSHFLFGQWIETFCHEASLPFRGEWSVGIVA